MIQAKICITCRQPKALAEFYRAGCFGIMRDCDACRAVPLPPLPAAVREVVREADAAERRRLRVAAAPGFASPEQLAARWAYYGGLCWMCRRPAVHMDHVKPLFRGGCNWASNQRPACRPCNMRKASRWPFVLVSAA